ncbi:MAG: hypothetical protein JW937_01835, partial [Candidatus Omnitrophica bacterium]|nr:hypothetical protein [Candidatus Omnitrophota bacterium]
MLQRNQHGFRLWIRLVALVIAEVFVWTSCGAAEAAPVGNRLFRQNLAQVEHAADARQAPQAQAINRNRKGSGVPSRSYAMAGGFRFPSEFGRVVEFNLPEADPNTGKNAPVVFHFQDLHAHPEAQANAAKILKHLYQEYGLSLIGSEGAAGSVDLTPFATVPKESDLRTQVANVFLQAGELTGEEYYLITERPAIALWGVEKPELYALDLIHYGRAMAYREQAGPYLDEVERVLDVLKKKIFPVALQELDEKIRLFEKGQLSLEPLIRHLSLLAQKNGLSLEGAYPSLSRMARVIELEPQLDTEAVQKEVSNLLSRVTQQYQTAGETPKMKELLELSVNYKSGDITPLVYYGYLMSLVPGAEEGFPATRTYIEYLEMSERIRAAELSVEIQTLQLALRDALYTDGTQRTLGQLDQDHRLLQKLFALELNAPEFQQVQESVSRLSVKAVQPFIQTMALKYGIDTQLVFDSALIDQRLAQLMEFYEVAHQRDRAMVETLRAQMRQQGVQTAALIAGGYHTEGMLELLRRERVGYVVIAPNAKAPMDETQYKRLLFGEPMSINELLASADKNFAPRALRLPLMSGGFLKDLLALTSGFATIRDAVSNFEKAGLGDWLPYVFTLKDEDAWKKPYTRWAVQSIYEMTAALIEHSSPDDLRLRAPWLQQSFNELVTRMFEAAQIELPADLGQWTAVTDPEQMAFLAPELAGKVDAL